MLPDVMDIEARLTHNPVRALKCKVLKDRTMDPVRMEVTKEILTDLRKEIGDLPHSGVFSDLSNTVCTCLFFSVLAGIAISSYRAEA